MPTTADLPPWLWPRAAYIHVPFCAHHCGYCDFAIVVGQDASIDLYLDALALELATLGSPQPLRTLFLGGGTPSHLSAAQLARLLTTLHQWLPLEPLGEFSIEANPESLDDEKLCVLAAHGVTRVSLGAQSFSPTVLRALERRHDPVEIPRAVERVRAQRLDVSLDFIFGAPGQTLSDWDTDLTSALALEPSHLSTYGLTYEKGTPLWKLRQRGEVQALDEATELALYETAINRLEAAGYEHYEISNFARPGHRCRHNETYWANEAYFGFGMGAARYVMGRRELNTRDFKTYLHRVFADASPTFQSEKLAPFERAQETMAVQLRRSAGIERRGFHAQTGFTLEQVAGEKLAQLVAQGLLADDGERVCLTRKGKYVGDAVIERLL